MLSYINVAVAMDAVKELELAENLQSILEDFIIAPWDQLIRSSAIFFTKCTKPKLKGICIVYEVDFVSHACLTLPTPLWVGHSVDFIENDGEKICCKRTD